MFKWRQTILTLLIVLALFFIDKAGFLDSSFNLISRVFIKPVIGNIVDFSEEAKFLFKNVFSVRGVIRENLVLKNQRDFFREEYFKLEQVTEENKFLRQALSLEKEKGRKIILANILAFDPFGASDSFLINKGTKDGLKISDPVILAGGILVGRIEEAGEKDSRVLLITSTESRVTIFTEVDKTNGVITGSASGALAVDLVLKSTDLKPGQVLLTSGLEGVFPAGLLAGEVSKIFNEDNSSFQKATAQPFFSPRDLKQVFVLIKS